MAIEIKDRNLFGKIIAQALAAVDNNLANTSGMRLRWINAIGKAAARIESNDFLMTWHADTETLVIWTVGTTNQVYETNGVCQCPAYLKGYPCWHKAAKQLIKNYFTALDKLPPVKAAAAVPMERAPYFPKTLVASATPQKIGNIRV